MEIDELSAGDVVVRVEYSSLNYKDARAVTGRGRPIMRRLPLNAGIDLAGVVESSSDPRIDTGHAAWSPTAWAWAKRTTAALPNARACPATG